MKLDGKTNSELTAMMQTIEDDPTSHMPKGSLNIYIKSACKKLDELAWAVTHNMAESRRLAGDPVRCDGYSGRNCNRR